MGDRREGWRGGRRSDYFWLFCDPGLLVVVLVGEEGGRSCSDGSLRHAQGQGLLLQGHKRHRPQRPLNYNTHRGIPRATQGNNTQFSIFKKINKCQKMKSNLVYIASAGWGRRERCERHSSAQLVFSGDHLMVWSRSKPGKRNQRGQRCCSSLLPIPPNLHPNSSVLPLKDQDLAP